MEWLRGRSGRLCGFVPRRGVTGAVGGPGPTEHLEGREQRKRFLDPSLGGEKGAGNYALSQRSWDRAEALCSWAAEGGEGVPLAPPKSFDPLLPSPLPSVAKKSARLNFGVSSSTSGAMTEGLEGLQENSAAVGNGVGEGLPNHRRVCHLCPTQGH